MACVDVIIPCYQYGRFLRECVYSVVDHQNVKYRILIIDDASTDNTAIIAADLAKHHRMVEVRSHSINRGHIYTYNEGLEWATSEYVIILSADDMLTAGALDRAAYVMDQHPEVGLTMGWPVSINGKSMRLQPREDPRGLGRYSVLRGQMFFESICAYAVNIVATPTAVVRTSLHRTVGNYRASLPHAGDMEMWLRLSVYSSVAVLADFQGYYRKHEKSMSNQYIGIEDLKQRKEAFDMVFREHGMAIEGSERLRGLAYRQLSLHAYWSAGWALQQGAVGKAQELMEFSHCTGASPYVVSG